MTTDWKKLAVAAGVYTVLLILGVSFLQTMGANMFTIALFGAAMVVIAIATLAGSGFPRKAVMIASILVILHLLAPDFLPGVWSGIRGWFPCAPTDTVCKRERTIETNIKEEKERRQAIDVAASRGSIPQQPRSVDCNIDRKPHYFPSEKPPYKVNPGGKCALALFIEGRCVYYTQNYNEHTAGRLCLNNGVLTAYDLRGSSIDLPVDVDRVWSTGAAFHASIGLWQPRYEKLFSWR